MCFRHKAGCFVLGQGRRAIRYGNSRRSGGRSNLRLRRRVAGINSSGRSSRLDLGYLARRLMKRAAHCPLQSDAKMAGECGDLFARPMVRLGSVRIDNAFSGGNFARKSQ